MAYIRQFKTASGAIGVQVCWKNRGEIVRLEHIGSALTEEGVKKLRKQAQKMIDGEKNPLFDLSRYDGV